ncbi:MAG TPA: hypothetical protein VM347_44675 [Nonomuraea sp.]|nr:hypothetical protein [Nonomuraea sp.]
MVDTLRCLDVRAGASCRRYANGHHFPCSGCNNERHCGDPGPDRGVATHYAQPIESGLTGYCLRPSVLGPDGIPVIIDPQEAAAHPDLAAMSVMVHGRNPKVLEAFATALAEVTDEHAPEYYEFAHSMSAPEIRRLLEEIMKSASTEWPVYSPFAREHFGRGKAEGKAEEAGR